MRKSCRHIDLAIDIALAAGNKVYSITERNPKTGNILVYLYDPLISQVKDTIDKEYPSLRYWEWKGVPHNPAEKGYACDECKVFLIFPNAKTPRVGA